MYQWGGLLFDWDDGKAAINAEKHGVTFDEAMTVFGDTMALDDEDREHSEEEDRRVITGRSDQQRVLTVVFTERTMLVKSNGRTEATMIRIIHAARATRHERRNCEEER